MAMHCCLQQFNFNFSYNCIYGDQQFTIQIMKSLSINPAISFCSRTPAVSHQVSLILSTPGPKLEQLTALDCTLPDTHKLRCANFLENIQEQGQKEIIFMGTGKQSFLRSISFMLLGLAYKQVNNYPHLLTLIKQQFFKPGVFEEMDKKKSARILNICHNIEIELISSETVTQFCQNNEQFMLGFYHVLIKIINESQNFDCQRAIEKIRQKFQIDCKKMFTQQAEVSCWAFGQQKKIYLFHEGEYLILVSTCTLSMNYPNHLDSHIQTRLQSQRDFSDIGQLVIPQASEQSTPKFKQNQQSIRYRKKSHKNSFGGQFEASTYNQLANLLNRSQVQNTKIRQKQAKKVFSVKFNLRNLEGDDDHDQNGTWLNVENEENKNVDIVQGCNILKNQTQMRNSNIEGNQKRLKQNQLANQEKGQRKKYLTASEMHELRRDIQSGISDAELKQQKTKSNSNNSNALSGQQQIKAGEVTTKVNQYVFPGMNLQNWKTKEGFKFSFSKKDSSRFVFKQIQSEYNEEHLPENPETPSESYPIGKSHEPMKSSLTNLNSANHSIGLLLEGEYFKKKQNNRKSLFIESSMSPIKQQVQSSQQEDQSASQSFKDQERDEQQQFIESEPVASPIKQIPKDANKKSFWGEKQKNNQKNYIKIFKPKNRKCSYLTQQVSTQKNTGISANDELRQNDYNITESSPISPTINPYSLKNQQDTSRNRVKKPAKIHKNSEAITESRANKKRFQQNPISFSQMIANVSQPEESHFSGFSFPKQKRQPKLSLTSNVSQFSKNPSFNVREPEGWIRKEVIYFFDNGIQNQFSNQNRRPEKYIFQRNPTKLLHQESNSMQSQVHGIGFKNNLSEPLHNMQKTQYKIGQSPLNQTKERTLQVKEQENAYKKGFLQYIERLGSPQNNIRSTIDTSKNTNAFSIRQLSNQPIRQNQPKEWTNNLNPENRVSTQPNPNLTSSPSKFSNTVNYPIRPQIGHYHPMNSGPPDEKFIYNQHSPKFIYSPKGSPAPQTIIRNNPPMVSNDRAYANTSVRKQLSPTLIINYPNFHSITNQNYGAQHYMGSNIEHRSFSPSSTIYSENQRKMRKNEANQIRHASYSTANLLSQPMIDHPPQIQKYYINTKKIEYQSNAHLYQNYSQQNLSMFPKPHHF